MEVDLLEQLNAEKQALASHPALQKALARQQALDSVKSGHPLKGMQMLWSLYTQGWSRRRKEHTPIRMRTLNDEDFRRQRIAVFSFALDSHDSAARHLVHFDNADCLLFCSDPQKTARIPHIQDSWQLRRIPAGLLEEGEAEAALYMKMHPAEFLHGYDYAIFLAPDIRLMADFRKMIQSTTRETGLAMHNHPWRDDVYEEAGVLKKLHKNKASRLDRQIRRYQGAGFPRHFGLFDTSMYVLNLHNPHGLRLLDLWWKECLKADSGFEQIAWPFVMWENDVVYDEIGMLGGNIARNPKLETPMMS